VNSQDAAGAPAVLSIPDSPETYNNVLWTQAQDNGWKLIWR